MSARQAQSNGRRPQPALELDHHGQHPASRHGMECQHRGCRMPVSAMPYTLKVSPGEADIPGDVILSTDWGVFELWLCPEHGRKAERLSHNGLEAPD